MKTKLIILALFTLISAQDVTLSFDCPEEVQTNSGYFSIPIMMENSEDVASFQMTIAIGLSEIEVININPDDIIPDGFVTEFAVNENQLTINSFSLNGEMISQGNHQLLTIIFFTNVPGEVYFSFSEVMAGHPFLDLQAVSGDDCSFSVNFYYIGDDCVNNNGEDGYLDCLLSCVSTWHWENWLGDGFCDYSWGPNFGCFEFGYDCGDCNPDWDGSDPLGFCSEECTVQYDTNADGVVNVIDIIEVVNFILGIGDLFCSIDFDGDGTVSVIDIVIMVNIILEG